MGTCHSLQSAGNNMEDTVALARQEREKQGPWEVEVSYGGEVDLHRHLASCDKNPGHHKFVPVDQFTVSHLPHGCRNKDIVCLVRALSGLTVRVSVKYVSEARPETDPGSDKPYPCYKNKGRNMMRVGTGYVRWVDKSTDDLRRHKTCECLECLISPTPETRFAQIQIATAAHVVYDDMEAAHATCHLFFDRGGTPDSCSGVVTLGGMSNAWKSDRDISSMIYWTHDLDLADRLQKMLDDWSVLWRNIYENDDQLESEKEKSLSPAVDLVDVMKNLVIIVSHPHGCSKQVSVGRRVHRFKTGVKALPMAYTTPTCPGSSGAPVQMVNCGKWFYNSYDLVHCGKCEDEKNLNYSSLFVLQQ